jgi:hypothetical protein
MAMLIRANIHRIPRVDMIVGIPRSGLIAASMIATLTNQKLEPLELAPYWQGLHILLVDDSMAGGETMRCALGAFNNCKVTTLAVYIKPNTLPAPDIHFEVVPSPRVFEWNWHRSKYLTSALMDIDGVISTETQPGEREKGQLLYRPARKVLALATGRKIDEWQETVEWLKKHEVKYGGLFLTPLGEKARDTKVDAIHEMKPTWVVESNIYQAEWIHARTGLPTLCVDANRLISS